MNDHDQIVDELDLEDFAKTNEGLAAPAARRYKIRIDKTTVTVDKPILTGREILALVNKTPEQYKLYEHIRGKQPIPIKPEQEVNLSEPGVERFTTMARDTTEGLEHGTLAREFRLPQHDEAYLNGLGLPWETIRDGDQWLLIHHWRAPQGYSAEQVTIALLIPPQYADTQIDMVYVHPPLARLDGKPIAALSPQPIHGDAFQRWSRHRTGANPWRPGVDDVASHLTLVDEWLRREFDGR
jgi:hypothetical protein